jgi:alpha-L-fucosidase
MSHLDWFHAARYGMFVHWGPYSVAGRGEWALNREGIPFEEYTDRYVRHFTTEQYDPAAWAALAREAGMKYIVLTTRHHDGFCLWDTKTTDFNAVRLGPRRDLVRPFVEAARTAGLKVGFYYSVADWHHPAYPGAYNRDWPTKWPDEAARQRFVAFYRAQLDELMTQYGTVDILWYDGAIPAPLDGTAANQRVKQLQPGILINERNGEPFDFAVAEQSVKPKTGAWESCLTLNDHWGYHDGDHDWKTPRDVIRNLLTVAGKGGNLLLNVGPRGDGTIPAESACILRVAGEWLRRNGEFLPNSSVSPFSWNLCAPLTTNGNRVYVHLMHSPGSEFCLAEIKNQVLAARYVATGQPVPFEQRGDRLFLRDLQLTDPIATTIRLDVAGKPEPIRTQETFWIPD